MELIKEEQVVKQRDFTPARGRILVRPHPKAERTEGGILLPPPKLGERRDEMRQFTGEVMRVGPPRYLSTGEEQEAVAEVGDDVAFTQIMPWFSMMLHLPGEETKEELYLLDQDDIGGVIG